jgi:hypothetical protein
MLSMVDRSTRGAKDAILGAARAELERAGFTRYFSHPTQIAHCSPASRCSAFR